MSDPSVTIRRIDAALLPPVRHAVLWPSVALETQLLPFDHAETTIHYGAFLSAASAEPIACLTLTKEHYKKDLPPSIADMALISQYQVHKFAVYQEHQGNGVGSAIFRHVLNELQRSEGDLPLLVHLDARLEQRGWYERFGLQVLDSEVFIKTGPTGDGPPVKYIRLGIVIGKNIG
jgi:GNAT superfamily N-acetyltransferase